MKAMQHRILRGALGALVITALAAGGAYAAKGGKPSKPSDPDDGDSGATRIPVCVTFQNALDDVIQSEPLDAPTYCDGDLKGRVSAFVGGNTAPEQILFDTNTSRKSGTGRELKIALEGIGITEAEFESELNVDFQGMAVGETKSIGARFIIPNSTDKNRCLLTYGDTAPTHSEPSCEGVANSRVWVKALADYDGDGTIDSWLIWADETVNVCRIQYINWAVQDPEIIHAPFVMLVEKMQ